MAALGWVLNLGVSGSPTNAGHVTLPGHVPHFEKTRDRTNRRLVTPPELDRYPQASTPDAQGYPGFKVHFEPTRNRTNRKLLSVIAPEAAKPVAPGVRSLKPNPPFLIREIRGHRLIPVAEAAIFTADVEAEPEGKPPSYFLPKQHRRHGKRHLVTEPFQPEFKQLETVELHAATTPTRAFFAKPLNRRLLTPVSFPFIDPATPAPAVFAALIQNKVGRRQRAEQTIEVAGVIIATVATPPLPQWPGFAPVKQHRRHQERRFLKPLELNEYPQKALSGDIPIELLRLPRARPLGRRVQLLAPIPFVADPVFPSSAAGGIFKLPFERRKETTRTFLVVVPLYEDPAPPVPFQYASLVRLEPPPSRRKPLSRKRQSPLATVYLQEIGAGFIGAAFRTNFHNKTLYFSAGMTPRAYVQGDLSGSDVYTLSRIRDYTAYLRGGVSSTIYLKTDVNRQDE